MHKRPEIAIITPNLLMGLGLKSILEKIIPVASVEIFNTIVDLEDADSGRFSHYFTAYNIFCNNRSFFLDCGNRTILMIENSMQSTDQGVTWININQNEETLVKDILKLREHSHIESHSIRHHQGHSASISLTDREKEVISYIAQGFINKEIASKMDISITTVISHRKNIVTKLGVKSVAGLTIHAINNGYVDVESITL